jgi:hypothetical protein
MSVAADRKIVRLIDEANADGLIENRTFEDAVVLGPTMVVPIEDVTLDSNTFVGDPKGIFLEFSEGHPIQGGIGLRHVTFRRCAFRNVSIAGTPDVIAEVRARFQFPEAATLEALEAIPASARG